MFRRTPEPEIAPGVTKTELQRSMFKNTRLASELVGHALDPDERVITYFRTPARSRNGQHALVFTNLRLLVVEMFGQGEISAYDHTDLRGVRAAQTVYRLTYDDPENILLTFSFPIDGGPVEVAAFLEQLRHLWERATGQTFRERDHQR